MTHPRIYEMLKRAGHGTPKAIEIIVDAKRGDKYALAWVRLLRTHSWGKTRPTRNILEGQFDG